MDKLTLLSKKIARLEKINGELESQIENLSRDIYAQYKEVQDVYDVLNYSILIIDKKGKILQSNLFAKEHILFDPVDQLQSLILDDKSKEFIEDILKTNESSNEEFQAKIKISTEETRPFLCNITLLNGHSGEKFVFTASEITNLKKEELKRSELQRQLMQQSFKEGMAENAISILHNIGNVLTGMIGSIESSDSGSKYDSSFTDFTVFIKNLRTLQDEDTFMDFFKEKEKREYLICYLESFSEEAEENNTFYKNILNKIKEKAHHIGSIITVQQQYADLKKGIRTSLTVGSVIEDCLLINESKVAKSYVRLNRNWDSDQPFSIEKNGFIQVLSNVVINAIESIEKKISTDEDYEVGHIDISSYLEEDTLIIKVTDDALGFSQEVQDKLFKFGFSTKERSSGFGLHNCQNFMNTQGGRFEITSEGENCGATVTIYIPLNTEDK